MSQYPFQLSGEPNGPIYGVARQGGSALVAVGSVALPGTPASVPTADALLASQTFAGVTPPAAPAGLTVTGTAATTAAHGSASANSLPMGLNGASGAYFPAPDTNSGNVRVRAVFNYAQAGPDVKVVARANGAGSQTAQIYCLFTANSSGGLTLLLHQLDAGSDVAISSGTGGIVGGNGTVTIGNDYAVELAAYGSTAYCAVQRLADGFWLTPTATWQSAPRWAMSGPVTGADLSGAGYAGVAEDANGGVFYLSGLYLTTLASGTDGAPMASSPVPGVAGATVTAGAPGTTEAYQASHYACYCHPLQQAGAFWYGPFLAGAPAGEYVVEKVRDASGTGNYAATDSVEESDSGHWDGASFRGFSTVGGFGANVTVPLPAAPAGYGASGAALTAAIVAALPADYLTPAELAKLSAGLTDASVQAAAQAGAAAALTGGASAIVADVTAALDADGLTSAAVGSIVTRLAEVLNAEFGSITKNTDGSYTVAGFGQSENAAAAYDSTGRLTGRVTTGAV